MARRLTTIPPRVATVAPRINRPPKIRAEIYGTKEWRSFIARLVRERGRRCENPACRRMYDEHGRPIRIYGDHIIELVDGGELLDEKNVQLLCGSCHTNKTLAVKALRDAQRLTRRQK